MDGATRKQSKLTVINANSSNYQSAADAPDAAFEEIGPAAGIYPRRFPQRDLSGAFAWW
jgi:hypothetical protein